MNHVPTLALILAYDISIRQERAFCGYWTDIIADQERSEQWLAEMTGETAPAAKLRALGTTTNESHLIQEKTIGKHGTAWGPDSHSICLFLSHSLISLLSQGFCFSNSFLFALIFAILLFTSLTLCLASDYTMLLCFSRPECHCSFSSRPDGTHLYWPPDPVKLGALREMSLVWAEEQG